MMDERKEHMKGEGIIKLKNYDLRWSKKYRKYEIKISTFASFFDDPTYVRQLTNVINKSFQFMTYSHDYDMPCPILKVKKYELEPYRVIINDMKANIEREQDHRSKYMEYFEGLKMIKKRSEEIKENAIMWREKENKNELVSLEVLDNDIKIEEVTMFSNDDDDLTNQVRELNIKLEHLKKENLKLKVEDNKMMSEISSDTIKAYKEELKRCREVLEENELIKKRLNKEIKVLKEVNDLNTRADGKSVEKVVDELNKLKEDLLISKKELSNYRRQNDELRLEIKKMDDDFSHVNNEVNSLESKVKSLEGLITIINSEYRKIFTILFRDNMEDERIRRKIKRILEITASESKKIEDDRFKKFNENVLTKISDWYENLPELEEVENSIYFESLLSDGDFSS